MTFDMRNYGIVDTAMWEGFAVRRPLVCVRGSGISTAIRSYVQFLLMGIARASSSALRFYSP